MQGETQRPIDSRPVPGLADRIVASLPDLRRFVQRRMGAGLRARESASDIVQSACRDLLRRADAFEDRGGTSFDAWLRAAAENKLRHRARHWAAARRGARTGSLDELESHNELGAVGASAPAESARPDAQAELQDEVERLRNGFATLGEEERRVLRLSQIEGRSYAEMALSTGRTSEAVRKQIARALARLAAQLAP